MYVFCFVDSSRQKHRAKNYHQEPKNTGSDSIHGRPGALKHIETNSGQNETNKCN